MDESQVKLNIAQDLLRQYESRGTNYCFSVIAGWNDEMKKPLKFLKGSTGTQAIRELPKRIETVVRNIKPEKIIIHIFRGAKESEFPDEEVVLEYMQTVEEKKTTHDYDVLSKITELIEKNNDLMTTNQELSGLANEKSQTLSALKYEHEKNLFQMKHQIELDRKNEKIEELTDELSEIKEDYKEAIESLKKFQDIYDGEQKIQSGARSVTQVLQGIVSVAPGLLTWAQKSYPALGSFGSALVSMPGQSAEPTGESAQVDFSSPEFARMQQILEFIKSLTESESELFFAIVSRIQENKSLMATIYELVKQ